MIVRMKKITVVVQSKDIDVTLKAMADSCALHIEHQKTPASENTALLDEKFRSLSRAIEILPDLDGKGESHDRPEKLVREILDMADKKEALIEGIKNIKKNIELWKDWGDFDPEAIYALEEKNVWVRLCKLGKKDIKKVLEGVIIEGFFKKGNIFYCH